MAIYHISAANFFSFEAAHSSCKKSLANRARDGGLFMSSKKSDTYNRVIQVRCYHSDKSLGNTLHPSAIVDHMYYLDNDAQFEAYANVTIPPTVQA